MSEKSDKNAKTDNPETVIGNEAGAKAEVEKKTVEKAESGDVAQKNSSKISEDDCDCNCDEELKGDPLLQNLEELEKENSTAGEIGPHAKKEISAVASLKKNSFYLLPNSFTMASVLAAFFAITQAMNGHYEKAAFAIFASMILDGMDGRVARWTKTQSEFGAQLDSLADMVAFGVAPALVVYMWQLKDFGKLGYSIAFVFCACAALRLALFNVLIGKVDKKWFIGIPSPTAAGLIAGLIGVHHAYGIAGIDKIALVITLFAGLSMIVQIKFWSFKDLSAAKRVPFNSLLLAMIILIMISIAPSLTIFLFFFVYSLSGYFMYFKQWIKTGKRPIITMD